MAAPTKPSAQIQTGHGGARTPGEAEPNPDPLFQAETGEFPLLDDEALLRSRGPSTGEILIHMWTGFAQFVLTRIWRPVVTLRDKAAAKFLDRTVDSDTFDRSRADRWKKFHDGGTSSSYLQDTDDK